MSYAISTIGDVAAGAPASDPIPQPVITVAGLLVGAGVGALATWYLLYRRKRR